MEAPPTAVVTGVGAVSAFGWTLDELAHGLRSGRTAIAPARRLDVGGHRTRVAGEVPDPPHSVVEGIPQWNRLTWAERFAIVAADQAVARAGLAVDGHRTALAFGGSAAGMAECEGWFARVLGLVDGRPHVRDLAGQQINAPGDAVARHLGVRGPVLTLSSACSSGGLAVGTALDLIRSGAADVVIAGGADALCHLTYGGFNSLRSVSAEPSRPFRADRDGLSLGEGAGVLVVESEAHAATRGAAVLARLVGWGSTCDAHHMTAPHPEGAGAASAIAAGLADAGLEADAVSFVNAHGTGTPLNDTAEAHALRAAFGRHVASLPVTGPKGALGHLLGASGAIEAVAVVLALVERAVQPTAGTDPADPDLGVDLVIGAPRPLPAGAVGVSTSLAFGGANAAVVIAAAERG